MSKNVEKICMICKKNKAWVLVASNGDNDCGFGQNRTVCKDADCRKIAQHDFIEKPRLDREIKELENDLKESDHIKQKWQKIVSHVKTGKDLSELWTDWETEIANLPDDKKKLCREYQKNIEEKEKILKDKGNYQQPLGNSPIQSDNRDNSNNNNNPSAPSSNHNNSSSNGETTLSCKLCEKDYPSEQEHNSQSPNCQEWQEIAKKALANIEKGMLNEHSKLNKLPEEYKNTLIALQELKINKQWVDIDNLDTSEENKRELRKIRDELGIKKQDKDGKLFNNDGKTESKAPIISKILILGIPILIIVVIVIVAVKVRNKKLKTKKK
jgi:hypothetical protein